MSKLTEAAASLLSRAATKLTGRPVGYTDESIGPAAGQSFSSLTPEQEAKLTAIKYARAEQILEDIGLQAVGLALLGGPAAAENNIQAHLLLERMDRKTRVIAGLLDLDNQTAAQLVLGKIAVAENAAANLSRELLLTMVQMAGTRSVVEKIFSSAPPGIIVQDMLATHQRLVLAEIQNAMRDSM